MGQTADNPTRRVQAATVFHYVHAKESILALAVLALPDNASDMPKRLFALPLELRLVFNHALLDKVYLTVMRMHDRRRDADGLPTVFRLLEDATIFRQVV